MDLVPLTTAKLKETTQRDDHASTADDEEFDEDMNEDDAVGVKSSAGDASRRSGLFSSVSEYFPDELC